jgi:hypothetical protein
MILRALIAGATGLIGSNLADHLVSKGWEVYGIARNPESSIPGVRPVAAFIIVTARVPRDCEVANVRQRFDALERQRLQAENGAGAYKVSACGGSRTGSSIPVSCFTDFSQSLWHNCNDRRNLASPGTNRSTRPKTSPAGRAFLSRKVARHAASRFDSAAG